MMEEKPFVMPAPNSYWGRKFGSVVRGELLFKLKRWGPVRKGNDHSKPKHYTALLAGNAIAKGWLNGERLKGKGTL